MCRISDSTKIDIKPSPTRNLVGHKRKPDNKLESDSKKHTNFNVNSQKTLILRNHCQSIARIYATRKIQHWWRKNKPIFNITKITNIINIFIIPPTSWQKQEEARWRTQFPKLFPIQPSKYTIQGQIQRAHIRRNKRLTKIF